MTRIVRAVPFAIAAVTLFVVVGCASPAGGPAPSSNASPEPTASVAGPPVPSMADPRPSPAQDVRLLAPCEQVGQLGYTRDGTLMKCYQTGYDRYPKWHVAG